MAEVIAKIIMAIFFIILLPNWIGIIIAVVIVLFGRLDNNINDIDDNEVFSELINDPAYSSLEGNIYHDLMEGTIK